ncbi:hypothetical protein SAMN05445871_1415 [Paraburkholderia caballeronis]|uniref:Uncharacterized protein n=1 Tax=Paraburkholderia caballeronis TaxID=416943 RepID=A0A1H7MVC2_9BURK|nr:hypothetical protein C7403_104280 [Paraburkholderia caballeronis]PXX01953.1 hypothetical protein C7407_104280 [Paraburkholderia caballeronis]RAK01110.1 hypothetical protein C7409_104280 [Paraburkholderia caballeronis]SEB97495.1 hypothetical protein SAMN05445871_1415 [Paraburkholderia caballeronis]SEL14989.1 hypothetical protein SAMN05192542_105189 [Paraburkholderia caballeronis]
MPCMKSPGIRRRFHRAHGRRLQQIYDDRHLRRRRQTDAPCRPSTQASLRDTGNARMNPFTTRATVSWAVNAGFGRGCRRRSGLNIGVRLDPERSRHWLCGIRRVQRAGVPVESSGSRKYAGRYRPTLFHLNRLIRKLDLDATWVIGRRHHAPATGSRRGRGRRAVVFTRFPFRRDRLCAGGGVRRSGEATQVLRETKRRAADLAERKFCNCGAIRRRLIVAGQLR